MEKLTYQQAYNKIIDAYFRDEIKPYSVDFCFCGTLTPPTDKKFWFLESSSLDYSYVQYRMMERALLDGIRDFHQDAGWANGIEEDALFAGMCAALEVLKEIHRSRNENVDEIQTKFTKRDINKVKI